MSSVSGNAQTDAKIDVYVAAGSNVDAARNLRMALALLQQAYAPLRLSPSYRNKAVGFSGDDFINLVVGFSTTDSVAEVRRQMQIVEARCGRPPDSPKWAPRTMDLDLLLYGQQVSSEPGLVLPRPDLVKRPYMLKPMADIAPHVVHPTLHKTIGELWQSFDAPDHEMVSVDLLMSQ